MAIRTVRSTSSFRGLTTSRPQSCGLRTTLTLLQPGVLVLELLQALGLADIHAAVFGPPIIQRRLRDAVLAREIPVFAPASCSRSTPIICSSLDLARFLCPSVTRPDSNSAWRKFAVARHVFKSFFCWLLGPSALPRGEHSLLRTRQNGGEGGAPGQGPFGARFQGILREASISRKVPPHPLCRPQNPPC